MKTHSAAKKAFYSFTRMTSVALFSVISIGEFNYELIS